MTDPTLHIDLRRLTAAVSLLAGIVEGSDDAILAKDAHGTIIAWNPAAERLFGYAEREAIGMHVDALIPDDHRGEHDRVFASILAGTKVEHYETVRRTKDGRSVEVSVTVSPLRGADGSIIGASKIIRDIGDHARTRTMESQLAAIVASSDDAIISKDREGRITSWNPAAQTLFGYAPDEVLGNHVSMLFPADLVGSERDILSEILEGRKVDHYETRRVTKDGRVLAVSLTVSPLRDHTGQIVGASKIVRDISERREVEARRLQAQELARANEQLAAADRAKDHFLAMANHELRTPLTSIAGFTDTLLRLDDQIAPEQRREFLEIIDRQSRRLTRLVDDLLTLSRMEIDRSGSQPQPVRVSDAVEEVLQAAGGIDAYVDVDPELQVCVDPQQFHQMLVNYLDNALKYGSEPLEVRARAGTSAARIEVRDSGHGVPEELLPRLFGRFSRGQRDMEAGVPGTGLGLAIVRGLARAHGGDAWHEPVDPHGSSFCLRLPMPESTPT